MVLKKAAAAVVASGAVAGSVSASNGIGVAIEENETIEPSTADDLEAVSVDQQESEPSTADDLETVSVDHEEVEHSEYGDRLTTSVEEDDVDLRDVGTAATHDSKVRPGGRNEHGRYDVAVGDEITVQSFYTPASEDLRIELGGAGAFVDDGGSVTFTVEEGSATVPVEVVAPITNDDIVDYDIAVDAP
ncbi:hypothetical protein C500_11125 [Natrialba magadii ATCC 43099]|uniref:Uncharacterized protein n=1 Tax=Natrialba magadii (strain ATCC 43099 / DSM 3394 / CCM 3739 / CIP 104546 / IAM 13178 / JCM 8861 / NBRC 102185 / NCIMB 2190 / MS3) TaxID=547559 RepID=L9UWE7_NATMM|nr:hypothetical protein C500_11125 [Natrialba magadii ATCC 43099]